MISDATILSMLFCGILTVFGIKTRTKALVFLSSIGLIVASLYLYQELESLLLLGMMISVAVGQMVIKWR